MTLAWWLRNLHVLANLFWIGSIVAVSIVLAAKSGSDRERGTIARMVYQRVAAPAFTISFVAGFVRLLLDLKFYFVSTHFMHAKLLLALGVIAVHHILGAQARRAAAGERAPTTGSRFTWALVVLAGGAAWFALAKPF